MARVTVVQRAQQRYAMVPVLDEDGNQKKVPVMKNGQQKLSKKGPVWRRLSVEDKSKPLPMPKCDYPQCDREDRTIKVGESYKWIAPKSGPYGGSKRYRHGDHPSWQVWEYSTNKRADIWKAQSEFDVSSADNVDDIKQAVQDFAEVVNEVAESYGESADNIEDGFGHETTASQELREQQESLEGWASDLESWEPDTETPEGCDDHDTNIVYDENAETSVRRWFVVNKDDSSPVHEDDPYQTEEEARSALGSFLENEPEEHHDLYDVEELDYDAGADECEACQQAFDDWLDTVREEADAAINEEP